MKSVRKLWKAGRAALAKKSKKHKKHEEHVDESWLVPYADILTLLLALFIVLFASSTVDQEKLSKMSKVFSEVFDGGMSIMDNPTISEVPDANSQEVNEQISKYLEDQEELQDIQGRIEEFIGVNELEEQFDTKMTDEGLLVTIRDSVLFDPGKATVKREYLPIARQLSKLLQFDPPRNIVITGHTDNVPMNNAEFRSNWQLSVMRATNFLTIIIDSNPQLDERAFSIKGFGEYNPIASNDTPTERAKNRRVEVLIQQLVAEDGSEIKP